ncbi:hypothetical protein GQF56_11835 [Rhodobacter sphaeroides]|jgi:hypothetical protein|uniref:Uncharacterized protein n=1 Tax=Cereibacter sphaeroides (strain ATCC 17023 / DSM 158 / JCM 6121 / CCUG 31486 / LMG 2827 / NBRC 12203 / NCIMB 8253 / ATH 2.4.1.) TaxID=272943 RepID=U5NMM7_CERS4|nr:hypothetical protein [Cereibacter sphaeroides]AGY32391.1 hypothetical protein RSP_7512 [Cereibacter sphaeroides 2.4.1]AMJ46590.1 hypothetical protein APX01_03285 [Cereibacter sphaeroides]ANS33303.1 hypothetical protein A3858_03295 [Cereibacter sphaeroides]ATN62346.1 hypothetical protein A3857_03290 [Cereibacter sphaeroides]AXC60451.1 hypothetical protein DQL45_03420 [Cereibacter sphaeroides 2.4.1]
MRRVYWYLMQRFYEARSFRAFCNHLHFKKQSRKYSSRLAETWLHRDDESEEHSPCRLPSCWWLVPSVLAGSAILATAVGSLL